MIVRNMLHSTCSFGSVLAHAHMPLLCHCLLMQYVYLRASTAPNKDSHGVDVEQGPDGVLRLQAAGTMHRTAVAQSATGKRTLCKHDAVQQDTQQHTRAAAQSAAGHISSCTNKGAGTCVGACICLAL